MTLAKSSPSFKSPHSNTPRDCEPTYGRIYTPQFVVDGELVIESEGRLAFDVLQMRLHPAESRIRKLSVETPARLILFDMLVDTDGRKLIDEPLEQRREALEAFLAQASVPKSLVLSLLTRNRNGAEEWLSDAGHGATSVTRIRARPQVGT